MKTIITRALIGLMLLAALVMAIASCDSAGLEFKLLDDGTYEVIGIGECEDLDIVIPQKHKGKPVTRIGEQAFAGLDEITSVRIPEGVVEIGAYAFSGCEELYEITIPVSVTRIDAAAFASCSNLARAEISDLAAWCRIDFYDMMANPLYYTHRLVVNGESVTDLVIPDGITEIGNYAFVGCNRLESVTVPDSVARIDNFAFMLCGRLQRVTLGESVRDLGVGAFQYCNSIEYTEYENGRYLGSEENPYQVLVDAETVSEIHPATVTIGGAAFEGNERLGSLSIPDGVTVIGNSAFRNCDALESVTIPDSVTEIAEGAFENCDILKEVTFGNGVTSIGKEAFTFCLKLESVMLPDSVKTVGESAFAWCTKLESVTIPKGVTSIGREAFCYCDLLTVYCADDSQPEGWDAEWNRANRPVIWGYEGE